MMTNKDNPSYDIGILQEDRAAVAKLLNVVLADIFVLYLKTLNAHWNVIGPDFGPMHLLFLQNYEMLFNQIDDVAERIRTLGFPADASLARYAQCTQIVEFPTKTQNGRVLIESVYESYLAVIRLIRSTIEQCEEKYHDVGTGNFLTDMMEKQEKAAWMLRAHLE